MAEAPVILAVLRALLPRVEDAEEVLSATLEIAMLKRGELRADAALRSWLLKIAIREAHRMRRRLQRFVRLDSVREPEVERRDADSHLAVRDALRHLPPRTRAAVVLHFMVGLSLVEVAQALGTSPNTVKTQLRVGLARLRLELES